MWICSVYKEQEIIRIKADAAEPTSLQLWQSVIGSSALHESLTVDVLYCKALTKLCIIVQIEVHKMWCHLQKLTNTSKVGLLELP